MSAPRQTEKRQQPATPAEEPAIRRENCRGQRGDRRRRTASRAARPQQSAAGRPKREIMSLGLFTAEENSGWWAVEAKISPGRPGDSRPDPPSCVCVFRSKKEHSIRELRRHRYYDGRRDVWGRGQRGEEEPGARGGERQPELRGEGSAPGRRRTARAHGQLLSAAGREDRRHPHTEPGTARCLRGFTSKSGSGSGKRNARDDLIQQKERGAAGKGLPKATGNQTPPRQLPNPVSPSLLTQPCVLDRIKYSPQTNFHLSQR